MPALRQANGGLPLQTKPSFATAKAQAPRSQSSRTSPLVVTPQLTSRPHSRVAQGMVWRTVPGPSLRPGAVQPPVVQRMEDIKKGFMSFALGAVTKAANLIYQLPNPFEMTHFTSCVCLVFNSAGRADRNYKTDISRNVVFDSIKSNWETHHTKGSFYDICPFDENDCLTKEWNDLMSADTQGNGSVFGDRPLIVIVGHSSPGSDKIRSDDQKTYSINDVYVAIRPALRNRCTIYLSPCNTGISTPTAASFQERFTQALGTALSTDLKNDFEVLTIGTSSTSFPAKGQVLTTGQTYSHVKLKGTNMKSGLINQEKYLKKETKS